MYMFRSLVYLLLLCSAALAAAQQSKRRPSQWRTLHGNAPLVIARGGFSGLFPDSSSSAYILAVMTSLPDVHLWCDVQLTKDEAGICFPSLNLENASNIANVFKNKDNTYFVNGKTLHGWFSVDFYLNDLSSVFLTQGIYSRSNIFDGSLLQILTVQGLVKQVKPPGLWLNIQHDAFFSQQNLSMRRFILSLGRSVIANYISSPEVNFLKSISAHKPRATKLVFRILGSDEIEPSTNQTYGSLLKNLTFVKTFASGILVSKNYIWPTDAFLYLQPHKSFVLDAHKEGLEVFASEFANDVPFAYNYSYNPVAEYLSFVDNGNFSVDGVVSDFPITPSEAIGCFSHIGKNGSAQAKPLIISFRGASGDYPGCTDLAYQKAVSDGVDILDCPVQMTKDGIPVCLSTINLIDSTTVVQSPFSNFAMTIPEIMARSGIFTFSLKWSDIQSLTPAIFNPYTEFRLYRNPKFGNAGKFMTLSEFLAYAKNISSVSGVLINIENAAYLVEKQGLSVINAVLDALSEGGYNNQTEKKVMIQSANSSVLLKFKETNKYELVYRVDESISSALDSAISDIQKFANSVLIGKTSIFPDNIAFLTGSTGIVSKLQAFKLSVYVRLFSNEFVSQAWDFFSDPNVEINSYVMGAGIDGIVTDFPATAAKYRRNRCLRLGNNTPAYMSPVQPGALMQVISPGYMPPAEAPKPVLTDADVMEPPLPSVVEKNQTSNTGGGGSSAAAASPTPPPNVQPKVAASIVLSNLAVLLAALMLF